jgi:hypothetical protein
MMFLWEVAWIACLIYVFNCITLWQIGKKFGIGRPGSYFIPVRNLVLLCRCAGVSGWNVLFCFIPIVNYGALIWIWGNVARRMGRGFWLYGILCSFLFFPALILAFGEAAPVRSVPVQLPPPVDQALELECVQGEFRGEHISIPFEAGNAMVIGRNPQSAHLVIGHPQVSGSHARIWCERRANGMVVVKLLDMASRNGTRYRISGGDWIDLRSGEAALSEGDSIRLSDTEVFRITRV